MSARDDLIRSASAAANNRCCQAGPVDGPRFGGYLPDEVVGHGGYAVVYRAHHRDGGAPVALKVLDERHRRPPHLDRLAREYTLAQRLDHPHIVRMYGMGHGWLAMELAGGGTVTHLAGRRARLRALTEIAGALDHAHRRGIVHCDVKPSNILLAQPDSGRALLIDFGIAHAVAEDVWHRPGHADASLPYAAPEVLTGHRPCAATDQYALACTAVELLVGTTPFVADTALGLIDQHVTAPVPRYHPRIDWVPRAFDSILAKAMAKDPDARYPSCTEFVTLIDRALSG
jgi:serine/threonine-protein kinase